MLSEEDAGSILDYIRTFVKMKNIRLCSIVFHGGEPTLNFSVIEYICEELLKETECRYSFDITTNGYNLKPEIVDYLKKRMDEITVSLDGNETMHNTCRKTFSGEGSYAGVIDTALTLNLHHPIRIRMTVNTENYQYLGQSVIDLINQGFQCIIPAIDYYDTRFNEQHFKTIVDEFRKIKKYMEETGKSASVAFIDKDDLVCRGRCYGGFHSLHIYADGRLFPCTFVVDDNDFCIGSIKDGVNEDKLREIDRNNDCIINDCAGCTFQSFCSSIRCKYLNRKLTGAYDTPSPIVCASERMKIELIKERR